jgi:hypothetical protein
MEIKVAYLSALMDELSTKTKQRLNYPGFGKMSEMIGDGISQKYLYENLHKRIENAAEANEEYVGMQSDKLDAISEFLGFKNFDDFVCFVDNSISDQLRSCAGSYYSYVRRNSEAGAIYRSPLRIFESSRKMCMELKGPRWSYYGEVSLKNGCLFILMQAEGGKEFHHVYKIGNRDKPIVLQGIFSGISTSLEPIGGRVVLTREDISFEKLFPKELAFSSMESSSLLTERRVVEYLKDYKANNLSIEKVVTFNLDDLGSSL